MGLPINEADWDDDASAALFDAVVAIETRDEAAAFLRDLCTRRELEEMRSRWAVVRLLDQDAYSYREIHDLTGVSTATITRINQWLQHGTGGYRTLLDRTMKDGTP
jgi:TrpR-related protein YerC/YecD